MHMELCYLGDGGRERTLGNIFNCPRHIRISNLSISQTSLIFWEETNLVQNVPLQNSLHEKEIAFLVLLA